MRRLVVAVVCVMAGITGAAQTQTSDPVQGPTFRSGIDLVAVDVAVVDDRGRPIEDLHAADFTVKIDGEPRRVVSADLVRVDVEKAKTTVADKSETFFTSNLTPPEGRQIVLAIDQVHIRPGSIPAVMQAAQRFLDKLSPLDQVAFIAFPEPGPRVGFTNDHYKLRLAMQKLIGSHPNPAVGVLSMGLSEALAIYEHHDSVVLQTVMNRECRRLGAFLQDCESEVNNQAGQIVLRMRQETADSVRGLEQILLQLSFTDGPKAVILISDGLATDRISDFDDVARRAAMARASLNVLLLDGPGNDITISRDSPTALDDRRLAVFGLQELAQSARGSLFHVTGSGEPIFDRLASELSAYYLLGVEQRPQDREGDKRRIDVQVRRRDAIIRSRQAFVLSGTSRVKRSAEDSLRDALSSPFAISGLPLRATTFAAQDPAGGKVRITIAADVGQPDASPAPFTIGYILIDPEGRIAGSFGGRQTLPSGGRGAPLEFSAGAVVDPGVYELRIAAVDSEGRRGSVVREVNAWKMAGEVLASGDLIVGNMPKQGQSMHAAVEPHVSAEALGAYIELYSTAASTFDGASVKLEIADDPDSPALVSTAARIDPGAQPAWRIADGPLDTSQLPPGRYVARARVVRGGSTVTILSRPFVLERSAPVRAAFTPVIPSFDRDAVLKPKLLTPLLDGIEQRTPALKSALADARAGRYGPAALDALGSGEQAVAAFLRGVELYSKGQLNEAATQLNVAAGPRREFFPAAFYLGACYAAAGRDRDAAGVWQLALGNEPRPPEVYAMAADARMRDGQMDAAIDILKTGYDRANRDPQIGRRLGLAYVITARHADALPLLDAYLQQQPSDQEALYAAIVAQYEVARSGQTLSSVDRAKVRKYAAAYTGPQNALVDKYLAAMQAR
jgi:VWFA-related protein